MKVILILTGDEMASSLFITLSFVAVFTHVKFLGQKVNQDPRNWLKH